MYLKLALYFRSNPYFTILDTMRINFSLHCFDDIDTHVGMPESELENIYLHKVSEVKALREDPPLPSNGVPYPVIYTAFCGLLTQFLSQRTGCSIESEDSLFFIHTLADPANSELYCGAIWLSPAVAVYTLLGFTHEELNREKQYTKFPLHYVHDSSNNVKMSYRVDSLEKIRSLLVYRCLRALVVLQGKFDQKRVVTPVLSIPTSVALRDAPTYRLNVLSDMYKHVESHSIEKHFGKSPSELRKNWSVFKHKDCLRITFVPPFEISVLKEPFWNGSNHYVQTNISNQVVPTARARHKSTAGRFSRSPERRSGRSPENHVRFQSPARSSMRRGRSPVNLVNTTESDLLRKHAENLQKRIDDLQEQVRTLAEERDSRMCGSI